MKDELCVYVREQDLKKFCADLSAVLGHYSQIQADDTVKISVVIPGYGLTFNME